MRVAVVILNWNGKALLERFLPDVVGFSQNEAQIYLADNASTDDSIAYCKEHFPDSVTVIQNLCNGGYAKGYNDALKHLDEELFILLNSDVAVTENWLTPIVKAFKEDEQLAAAQPKIKDLKNPNFFEYAGAAGGFLDRLGYPYCRGRIFDHCEKDIGQYNATVDIQWASGACLFIRASAYSEVNGLDEHFFAHQEEIDLCWRLKNVGYRIKAFGNSEVYHLGGATLSNQNPKKTFYNFRNTLFAMVKNIPGKTAYLLVFCRLLLDGVAGIKFLLEGKTHHFLAIIKAHGSFYKHSKILLKKRNQLKKTTEYYQTQSIVFDYFVKGKTTYKEP